MMALAVGFIVLCAVVGIGCLLAARSLAKELDS